MKKEKNKKFKFMGEYKIVLGVILLLAVIIFADVNMKYTNDVEVENVVSMINEQYEKAPAKMKAIFDELKSYNNITGNTLQIGQVLRIP